MARWALIVGDKGQGKTSLALQVVAGLRSAGVPVAGFVQRGVHEDDGRRVGYDLVRLADHQVLPLARSGKVPREGEEAFCSHVFDLEAFAAALRWLHEDGAAARVLVLDEISKLESAGRGHAAAVRAALALPGPCVVVLCVRAEALFGVVENLLGDAAGEPVATLEVGAGPEAVPGFLAAVRAALAGTTP
jgi:nucleoside-triphosphatase THEP1